MKMLSSTNLYVKRFIASAVFQRYGLVVVL